MRILQPKVELWTQNDWKAHVARCARVCYASDKQSGNDEMVDRLIEGDHLSMFRHRSMYWIISGKNCNLTEALQLCSNNPYVRFKIHNGKGYFATNGHWWIENKDKLYNLGLPSLSEEDQVSPEKMYEGPGRSIMRYSIWFRTGISTSRELNRVSPNNISEQSTRYCNYTKDKFTGEGAICTPWWFDLHTPNGLNIDDTVRFINDGEKFIFKINDEYIKVEDLKIAYAYNFLDKHGNHRAFELFARYITSTFNSMVNYNQLVELDMMPQDARGVLPLDTCTEVVYTYFIDEWHRIFENRVDGKRGKPHPNAVKVVGMAKELLEGELQEVYSVNSIM